MLGLSAVPCKCRIYGVRNAVPVTVPASPCPSGHRNWLMGSWAPVGNHIDTAVYGRHPVVPNVVGCNTGIRVNPRYFLNRLDRCGY